MTRRSEPRPAVDTSILTLMDFGLRWVALRCVTVCEPVSTVWMCVCVCIRTAACLLSVSSSCINKKAGLGASHTPEPGDSRVPQLLHARCLIVLFCIFSCPVPLPLRCWWWENTQQYACDSALSILPPPFPPSRLPLDSVPRPLLTRSPSHQSGSLRKKLWSDSLSHNNAKRAATFFRITLGVWLTPVQIQYDGQKNKNETVFKSKSSPGRETPPDITHTHSLAKVSYTCTLLFLVSLFTSICVSSGRVSRWIPQSLLLTSSIESTPRQSASSLSDMIKSFLYAQLQQVLTALDEMIRSLSSGSFNNTLHRECISLSL